MFLSVEFPDGLFRSSDKSVENYRRIDVSTNTERRICYQDGVDTQFCIITRTRDALAFPSCSVMPPYRLHNFLYKQNYCGNEHHEYQG